MIPTWRAFSANGQPTRLKESCNQCLQSKVKCSKNKPQCHRCVDSDRTCEYGVAGVRGRRGSEGTPASPPLPEIDSQVWSGQEGLPAPAYTSAIMPVHDTSNPMGTLPFHDGSSAGPSPWTSTVTELSMHSPPQTPFYGEGFGILWPTLPQARERRDLPDTGLFVPDQLDPNLGLPLDSTFDPTTEPAFYTNLDWTALLNFQWSEPGGWGFPASMNEWQPSAMDASMWLGPDEPAPHPCFPMHDFHPEGARLAGFDAPTSGSSSMANDPYVENPGRHSLANGVHTERSEIFDNARLASEPSLPAHGTRVLCTMCSSKAKSIEIKLASRPSYSGRHLDTRVSPEAWVFRTNQTLHSVQDILRCRCWKSEHDTAALADIMLETLAKRAAAIHQPTNAAIEGLGEHARNQGTARVVGRDELNMMQNIVQHITSRLHDFADHLQGPERLKPALTDGAYLESGVAGMNQARLAAVLPMTTAQVGDELQRRLRLVTATIQGGRGPREQSG